MQKTHIAFSVNQDTPLTQSPIDSSESETMIPRKQWRTIGALIIVAIWITFDIIIGQVLPNPSPLQSYILTLIFIPYAGLLYWWYNHEHNDTG